jgi:hypothetical protein
MSSACLCLLDMRKFLNIIDIVFRMVVNGMKSVVENPYRRTITLWIVILVAALAMIFVPGLIGIEGMYGGYAISFVSFFGVIVCLIVVLVYRGIASRFDDVVGGMDVLASWRYPSDLWMKFNESEYTESIEEVKPLFYLVSGMCLVAGICTYLYDPEPGIYVLGLMVVIVVLMALAAYLTRRGQYNERLRGPGEVVVSKRAVLVNRSLFYWDYFGSRLRNVKVRRDDGYSVLEFTTWAPTMQFGQFYTLRVPIPPGEEEKARQIAHTLSGKGG